jgi:hypothetical protein
MGMTTYSFTDVSFSISHPGVGKYIASGEGIGNINISMTNDRTAHDVASDGSVMVSKIRARNGSLSLAVQQTSGLNRWLMKWYNYLETAPTSAWADTTIVIRCPRMGEQTTAIGVSPQKLPDKPYQAQGQNVNWALLAADIQQDVI